MHTNLVRLIAKPLAQRLRQIPAVALFGARQAGKSTLAKGLLASVRASTYLDLELPSDRNKLADPEAFFSLNAAKLICLDEIQRAPELFPILRSVIDQRDRNGQFLLLGSSSPDLLRQSSETLAGRLGLMELTPFLLPELNRLDGDTLRTLWLRGGFPRSVLAASDQESYQWRQDFVRTYLERDIPQLASRIPGATIGRFWTMCAHAHGQMLNQSRLGESLGVSYHTVRSYLDLLVGTYVVRVLEPFHTNVKKRLVKSPKVYLRDTGLLHALLDIRTQEGLLGHPVYGASWEGLVVEHVCGLLPEWRPAFYRASSGAELDLVLELGSRRVGIECKSSSAPTVKRGFWSALSDLSIHEAYVVAPVKEAYPIGNGVKVVPLSSLAALLSRSA